MSALSDDAHSSDDHPPAGARLKVVHMSSAHRADDARIFHKECASLARAGYEIVFVVPDSPLSTAPGVRVRLVPRVATRFRRMLVTPVRVARAVLSERADICHFHDPELIPVGFALKALGKRVVYDAHEDLPRQILDKHWIPRGVRRLVATFAASLEWVAGHVFDLVVVPTEEIFARFPKGKTVLVRNYPKLDVFGAIERGRRGPDEVVRLVYIGAISETRGFLEMVEAVGMLDSCELILAGPVSPPDLLRSVESTTGWARTTYLGVLSWPEIPALLASVHIGLLPLHPTRSYIEALPTKLYEYMAAGLPIIASRFDGWPEVIDEAKCGLLFEPRNARELADCVLRLIDAGGESEAMGQRGRVYALEEYSWEHEADNLLRSYATLS